MVLAGVIVHAKQKKKGTKTATPGITTGNDAAVTAVSQGSAGTMERSGVVESVIVIGNDNAGNVDAAATTAVSQGSGGAMHRCMRCVSGIPQRLQRIHRIGRIKFSIIMFNCQARFSCL